LDNKAGVADITGPPLENRASAEMMNGGQQSV
jgi:hypothetical protein